MFLVCGEAVIDLFQTRNASEIQYTAKPAGSPFNLAIGLARMGLAASFMTGLSRDVFGEALISRLDEEGVDWHLSPRTAHPTILSFVMTQPDGTPEYAFYGTDGADFQLTIADLPLPLNPAIHAVHAGGFPTALGLSKQAYAALIKAAARRCFVSFDPNIRPRLMGDLQAYRAHLEQLLPSIDLVKASVEDIEALYPSATPASIAEHWIAQGTACVVMTDGERGATAYGRFGSVMSEGRVVSVVDTVGAGDSFMAGLLAHLSGHNQLSRDQLHNADAVQIHDALNFANRAAAITCTRQGADPPRRLDMALN